MKKNIFLISGFLIVIGFAFLSSCVKDTFDEPEALIYPNFSDSTDYSVITIDSLKKLYDGDTTLISKLLVIEGNVISSDEFGNFYKELYIQDSTGGISIQINQKEMYLKYPFGKKIAVVLNGLCLGSDGGNIQLGTMYWADTGYSFGQIPQTQADKAIYITGRTETITPKVLKVTELNTDNQYSYIRLENMKFVTTGITYSSSPSGIYMKDSLGNQIILYTSSYATFATDTVPSENFDIDGIFLFYGTKKEFIISDTTYIHIRTKI